MVLEVIEDKEKSRAEIQALNTALTFLPINKVRLDDLEIVQVETNDLMGHKVTINKSDYSLIEGRVIKASEEKIDLNMSHTSKGVQTNVWLTIVDNNGTEHFGTLLINQ